MLIPRSCRRKCPGTLLVVSVSLSMVCLLWTLSSHVLYSKDDYVPPVYSATGRPPADQSPFIIPSPLPVSSDHGFRHNFHARKSYMAPIPGSDWSGTYDPFYFFIYSAFYDDRAIHQNPRINIWGLVRVGVLSKDCLSCLYTLADHTTKETAARAITPITSEFTRDRVHVASTLIWCSPPTPNAIPTTVTIMHKNATNKIKRKLGSVTVEVMPKVQRKGYMAACVCALYAPSRPEHPHLRPSEIVQWVEMQRIMGVDHVTVYVNMASTSVLSTLQYYVSIGYLSLRSISQIDDDPYMQPRFTSLGDCMQRHMYSHHHVLVVDFDEVIVPRENLTLVEFIKQYSRIHKLEHVHYHFQNVWFFTDGPNQDSSKPEYLSFLRTRHHQEPWPFPGPMKSVQDPSICKFGSNHKCWMADGKNVVHLNHTLAASHHYKACETAQGHRNCTKLMKSLPADDIMLRYEHTLTAAVQRVLRHLAQYMIVS